jgi:ribosomal protein S27E
MKLLHITEKLKENKMNFLKSIICFLFKHDVSIYSDKSACSITCKRCGKVLLHSAWEELSPGEICSARKYFGDKGLDI